MGQKFSWEKLLKKKEQEDNTIQLNQPPAEKKVEPKSAFKAPNLGPLAPLNDPVPTEASASADPLVPHKNPEDKAPLVIDWEDKQPEVPAVEEKASELPTGQFEPFQSSNPESDTPQLDSFEDEVTEEHEPNTLQPVDAEAEEPYNPDDAQTAYGGGSPFIKQFHSNIPSGDNSNLNVPTEWNDPLFEPENLRDIKPITPDEIRSKAADLPKADIPITSGAWDDVELTPAEKQRLGFTEPENKTEQSPFEPPVSGDVAETKSFEANEPVATPPPTEQESFAQSFEPIDVDNWAMQALKNMHAEESEPELSWQEMIARDQGNDEDIPSFDMPSEPPVAGYESSPFDFADDTVADAESESGSIADTDPAESADSGITFPNSEREYRKEVAPEPASDPYKPKGIFGVFRKDKSPAEPENESVEALEETPEASGTDYAQHFNGIDDAEPLTKEPFQGGFLDEFAETGPTSGAEAHYEGEPQESTQEDLVQAPAADSTEVAEPANGWQDATSDIENHQVSADTLWNEVPDASIPSLEEEPVTNQDSSVPDIFKQAMGIEPEAPLSASDFDEVANEPDIESFEASDSVAEIPQEYKQLEDDPVAQAKDKKLGELLIESGVVTQSQLMRALGRQAETKEKLGQILIGLQMLSEKRLLQALAAQKGANAWHLEENAPQEEAVNLIPEEVCRIFQILPVALRNDYLVVAMADTTDPEAQEAARQHAKRKVDPVLADDVRLAYTIDTIFGQTESRRIAEGNSLIQEAMDAVFSDDASLTEMDKTMAVDKVIDSILANGVSKNATDVHIEPHHDRTQVRLRIDGELENAQEIPNELLPVLTSRLKAMAGITSLDECFPAEGILENIYAERPIEFRLNFNPGTHGTRTAIRVMDRTTGLKPLDELGFDDANLELVKGLIQKPNGLLVVSGPATSGKTTTIYSILEELKSNQKSIATCEDPVEYDLYGISQTQINRTVGFDMATQLKAVLKQDPDIVMVGEITDKETLNLAIRAAITGHLVVTSVHATDATSALASLLDLGAEPQLLGAALIGITNQHLVKNPVAQSAEGGSQGRTIVAEVLPIPHELKRMIAQGDLVEDVADKAKAYGFTPYKEDQDQSVA